MYKQLTLFVTAAMLSTASAAAPTDVSQLTPSIDTTPSATSSTPPHSTAPYFFFASASSDSADTPQTELDVYKIANLLSPEFTKALDDPLFNYFTALASLSLGLGYTYKLGKNMVVVGEKETATPVAKPKLGLVYKFSNSTQLHIGLEYNFSPRPLVYK